MIASVGVATTKFLAKLASDLAKPDGLLAVRPGDRGRRSSRRCRCRDCGASGRPRSASSNAWRVRTIGDVAALPEPALTAALGNSLGQKLLALAHNDDPRPVVPERETKSIGAEETFARRPAQPRDACDHELVRLVDRVTKRLHDAGVEARTITLKFRYGDFETRTRSRTLPSATDVSTVFLETARELLEEVECDRGVRLLGVSLSQLAPRRGRAGHARPRRRGLVGPTRGSSAARRSSTRSTRCGIGSGRESVGAGVARTNERRASIR